MENCQTQRNSAYSGDHKERFRFELDLKTCKLCSKTDKVASGLMEKKVLFSHPIQESQLFSGK